jgi:hypothetical protein
MPPRCASAKCAAYAGGTRRSYGDGGQITVFGKGDQTRSIQLRLGLEEYSKVAWDAGDDRPSSRPVNGADP